MFKKLTAERLLYLICVGLLVYMPFHLFLSRWLSLYTGGLGQWDGAKDIVTVVALGLAVVLSVRHKLYRMRWLAVFFVLSFLYFLIHLAYYVFDRNDQDTRSFLVATLFNGRILAYFFIAAVAALTTKINLRLILKTVIVVSTITCLIALVQYFSPASLMTHFGYSVERGAKPSFFIDDKPDFPRVMSTIRDPNSYGAYLIVPILVLVAYTVKSRLGDQKILALLLLHGAALFLTFSRGAWLGLVIGLLIYSGLMYGRRVMKVVRANLVTLLLVVCLIFSAGVFFRNSYIFQNVIFHSDQSTVQADPNELRVQLTERASKDILADPEGHGPGTAGLASIGNPHGSYLTENYFLQIAYEIGAAGLIVFLSLLIIVAVKLVRSKQGELSKVLLASFGAYLFIGTLIHLWSNEAVAAQWWLLAGLLLGSNLRNSHNKRVAD